MKTKKSNFLGYFLTALTLFLLIWVCDIVLTLIDNVLC